MKYINDIFNDFMLSMVNEKNATLIQELRVRWRHYLGQVSYPLPESKPLQRTPLLKTVDGFDKYEGDLVWRIAKDLSDGQHPRQINIHPDHVYPDRIYFENLDALKEYVILNKPCMSVQEVMNRVGAYFKLQEFAFENLKEFAKQKLGKQ